MKSPLIKTMKIIFLPSPPLELPKFNGSLGSDPVSHIDTYSITYIKYIPYDVIILKIFPRNLTEEALKWFYLLPEVSIYSFQQMVDLFI